MIVWIVTHGELHEGGAVVSVHKSKKNAINAALAVECHFSGGWTLSDSETTWVNGCDFVVVHNYKVKP